ncbi:hypothetical protein [Paraglaciecola sp. L1A13]|uniref:hypothetical protein n=1 Tax=Paraglaciecola sp. L1A13 TaxID=2686359 RepID=UPI00131C9966|nr:hypothetical protein [Paraglaciecola sp. L1A13]
MRTLKSIGCILTLPLLIPLVAQSCELHSGRGFGIFSSFHPLEQMHYQQTFTQPLHVTHPSSVKAETNTPTVVKIDYGIPDTYKNVVIRFSGSDNVTFLDGVALSAQGASGSYPLKYHVTKPGSHKISLHINALNHDVPVDFTQSITVNAT